MLATRHSASEEAAPSARTGRRLALGCAALVAMTAAAGAQPVTTGYTWHPVHDAPEQIVEAGLTTDLGYDDAGRLVSQTQTDTTSHTVPYPTAGRKRIWIYGYGIGNRLTSVDGPLPGPADTTTYTYTPEGNLETVTDPAGLVTTVTRWNGRGQPTEVTDPNGVATAYIYDDLGRLTGIAVDPGPAEQRWTLTYTEAGDVETLEEPAGRILTFGWDGARRLKSVTDNLGERTDYTRDPMGNVTDRVIARSDGTKVFHETGAFDELGRLIRRVGGETRTWRLAYDRTDRLTGLTDPRQQIIGFGYDAVGRLVRETERDEGVVVHGYNGKSEEVSYTDPRNLTTLYVRNGFGEVIQETSPDRGTTIYDHDERGLVTRKTDARGVTVAYAYDAVGRVTAHTYADAALNVAFTYDGVENGNHGKGRPTRVEDSAGATDIVYDAKGRRIRETRTISGIAYPVAYGYDGAGRLERVTYPSGRIVRYGYDAVGRVNALWLQRSEGGAMESVLSGIEYLPDGPLAAARFGNGLALTRSHDAEYRIASLTLAASDRPLLRWRYEIGDGLNLTAIVDEETGTRQEFGYDPAGRLAHAASVGAEWTWRYDRVGNRLAEVHAQPRVVEDHRYSYGAASNRLLAVQAESTSVRAFGYDPAGHLIQDLRSGTAYGYSVNEAGRIATVTVNGRVRARYAYDAFSRLSTRELLDTVPSGTTHLIHDQHDRVIAEADASGRILREYVWLDGMPVAVLDGSRDAADPALLFVHADHLERPVLMTDAAQAPVWRAVYQPFGAVAAITGPASLDLRFPGQWFQLETDLHYNWHRHYDPSTGRYTAPDPLGLHQKPLPSATAASPLGLLALPNRSGPAPRQAIDPGQRVLRDGPSLYAYAASDPLQRSDPNGLQSRTLPLEAHPFAVLSIPGRRTRMYDANGMACIDIEYGHSHREDLHWHYWIGTKRKFGGWGLPW